MKTAVVRAIEFCVIVSFSISAVWGACSMPVQIGHGLDSYLLCDDRSPVQAFIYEITDPSAGGSGVVRVECRATGATPDPGIGLTCNGSGAGVLGDGQVAIETDAYIPAWIGCPAPAGQTPKRLVLVVADGSGRGLLLSVSGLDPGFGYYFETAHAYDETNGTIGPVACGSTSGRPGLRGVSVTQGVATLHLHMDRPVIYSDCDPGSLGRFIVDSGGGNPCADDFSADLSLGALYTRVDACPSAGSPRIDSGMSAWTRQPVAPDDAGDAILVVPVPTVDCLYVAGSGRLAGGGEFLTGYIIIAPQVAASPGPEDVRAVRDRNWVTVSWRNRSEIEVVAYRILTRSQGHGDIELLTLEARGAGGAASYTERIDIGSFKGGRSVTIRALLADGRSMDAPAVGF